MFPDSSQRAFSVAVGTASTNQPFITNRNPNNATDVNYPIGKFWLNQANSTLWYLNSQTNATSGANPYGFTYSNWILIGGGIQTLEGDDLIIVSPTANNILLNGQVVANSTYPQPVYTKNGAASNQELINVQVAAAIASPDINKTGLAAFNSSQFTVDANGFVSASGSVTLQFTGNTGTAVPSAGNINILGASTAAGTSPVSTTASGSTVTVNVQKSQAIAAPDATKVGLAAFNSAQFSVDATGYVSSISSFFPFLDIAVNTLAVAGTGYFCTAALTLTLPASPSQGNIVKIIATTSSLIQVTANTGQFINMGFFSTGAGGKINSNNLGNTATLIYRAADQTWYADGGTGNWDF